jgi:hypothetical protein
MVAQYGAERRVQHTWAAQAQVDDSVRNIAGSDDADARPGGCLTPAPSRTGSATRSRRRRRSRNGADAREPPKTKE